jgi:hypothetical protein
MGLKDYHRPISLMESNRQYHYNSKNILFHLLPLEYCWYKISVIHVQYIGNITIFFSYKKNYQ